LRKAKRKIKKRVDKSIYKKPWLVYIVECSDKTFYVGIARDVDKRIKAHNSTNWCRYTRSRKPVKLLYQEKYEDYKTAWRREKEVKRFHRSKKLKIIKAYQAY